MKLAIFIGPKGIRHLDKAYGLRAFNDTEEVFKEFFAETIAKIANLDRELDNEEVSKHFDNRHQVYARILDTPSAIEFGNDLAVSLGFTAGHSSFNTCSRVIEI